MTKEEARRKLAGTWNFRMLDGMVLVADEALLRAVNAYTGTTALREASMQGPPTPRPSAHGALQAYGHA